MKSLAPGLEARPFGNTLYYVKGIKAIPPGDHQVRMEFAYDGGGLGQGGTATIYIDGEPAGQGRIEQTEAFRFSADETLDVGNEFGSPVTIDYDTGPFNGKAH